MQNQNPTPRNDEGLHSADPGVASEEQIKERAREIAEIDERSPEEVTEADRALARRELRGEDVDEPIGTEKFSTQEGTRDPADTTVDHGDKAPANKPLEEQRFMEKEAEEGARQAEHERAVRAHEENQTGS